MKKIKHILSISLLIGVLAVVPYALAVFSDPLTLVNSGRASNSSIAIDSNGVVYAIWAEFDTSWIQRDIYLTKSVNGGTTFSTANNITNTSVDSRSGKIFIDSNNKIHIAWEEDNAVTGTSDILYVQSGDGGQNFSSPKNISNNTTQSVSPTIVVDDQNSSNIYIAWTDETTNAMQIFFSRSNDGGLNFDLARNMSNTDSNTDKPKLGFRHGLLHLIWQSEDPTPGIFYTKSADNGNTFVTIKNISNNTFFSTSDPRLDFSTSTHVHAVWTEYSANEPEIMYAYSVNSGDTFEAPQNFSNSSNRVSEKPSIYVKSNKVYILWSEDVCSSDGCVKRIYRRFSANDGQTFSAPTSPLNLQVFKATEENDISVFGADAYILWQQLGNILFTKGQ